jgi:hypothetical protein
VTTAPEALLPEPGPETGTGWFVYGVARPDLVVPDGLVGVDDQPVQLLRGLEVAAIAGVALLDRPPGRRAEILAYSSVLDTLAVPGPVAPVRFGSLFADDQDVADHLLAPPSTEALSELLDELTGRVQLSLSASYHQEALLAGLVASSPEIARLRERTRDLPEEASYAYRVRLGELVAAAVDAERSVDAGMLLDAVEPLCAAVADKPGRGMDGVLEAALLVDNDRWEALEQVLEDLAEQVHERIRLRLVGPTAPYDFVGGGPWA